MIFLADFSDESRSVLSGFSISGEGSMAKKTVKRSTRSTNSSSKKSSAQRPVDVRHNLDHQPYEGLPADRERGPDFLPFDADFMPAANKRFQETIVFVHHFGGNKKSLAHHVEMVNALGYDAVRFDLMFSQINPAKHLPITANLKFGIRHVWSEQIEAILNSIPGRKILFSFSMPSNSVMMALAHRRAKDVSGWICDGGPFLQLSKCVWNLYEHHYAIQSKVVRGALTGASLVFLGTGFEKEAAGLMRTLPRGFRILSFRGLQDPLVPAEAIDEALLGKSTTPHTGASKLVPSDKSNFKNDSAHPLMIETHSFEEGGHLDGLKSFPAAYRDHCESFLKEIAKPVTA